MKRILLMTACKLSDLKAVKPNRPETRPISPAPNQSKTITNMKPSQLVVLSCIALAAVSCKTITGETNSYAIVQEGVPGGEVINTSTIRATVTGIDPDKRRIMFVTPSGEKFSTVAGPAVVNFDQIRIGDQLLVTATEEVVIRMAKSGEKVGDEADATIGVAPIGARPGMSMTETVQVVATVTAIDTKKHKATLRFPDGATKTIKVRKDVDLSKHSVGEKVVIRSTESFAVKIEKP